jgi:flavin-dependent dehydrogenase
MRICIVGGGSSGWMTATTFVKLLNCDEVSLVESPNIPISGVGESTIEQIRGWINLIGVDEGEMIRETNGSLKHSIKFTNFLKKDSGSFHYPFGQALYNPNQWWENINNTSPNKYAENVNPVALVAERGKFDKSTSYAFHFDAVKFGHYLKKTYCSNVKHITAEVVGCEKGENGIECLKLDNGDVVKADLYIDCSGFKSLLLGEYMEEPFIPCDHLIPNDTAWATQVSYTDKENQLVAYTECTAIDNGWVWNIPLWERIGTGYVYSSKHVSDEDAKQEFISHLQSKGFDTSECIFKRIPMRIGRHEKTFVKNVVAIGLSAGFIEPLESNGLFTVHQNLIDLYKTLRRGKPSQFMKDLYNSATSLSFDEFADFVAVHYTFTQREDTPYWRDNFNRSYELVGSSNFDKYGLTAFSRELYKFSSYSNLNSGFHYVASGMNVSAYTDIHFGINDMNINNSKWEDTVEKLPTLFEYLSSHVYSSLTEPTT